MFSDSKNRKIQELKSSLLDAKKIRLLVQHDESIYDSCSGNKWWKLKYNLLRAKELKHTKIVTFGGAFSNHILATAAACNKMGFQSVGVIRGEELGKFLNPTLLKAKSLGMEFHFVDRETYRRKDDIDWTTAFNKCFILPEGGTNELAVKGCEEFLCTADFDVVCCSVGTGGTLSGVINSLQKNQFAIGFSALKNAGFLKDEIGRFVESTNWDLKLDAHYGGYAKMTKELVDFMNDFKANFNIPLDPIYTAKLFKAVFDLIENDYFEAGKKILLVHSGGLQGVEGMNQKLKCKGWVIAS